LSFFSSFGFKSHLFVSLYGGPFVVVFSETEKARRMARLEFSDVSLELGR
jgi:hypothetical protein